MDQPNTKQEIAMAPKTKPRDRELPIWKKVFMKFFYVMLFLVVLNFYVVLGLDGLQHVMASRLNDSQATLDIKLNALWQMTITRIEHEDYQGCLARTKLITDAHFCGVSLEPDSIPAAEVQEWRETTCGALFTPFPQDYSVLGFSSTWSHVKNTVAESFLWCTTKFVNMTATAIGFVADAVGIKKPDGSIRHVNQSHFTFPVKNRSFGCSSSSEESMVWGPRWILEPEMADLDHLLHISDVLINVFWWLSWALFLTWFGLILDTAPTSNEHVSANVDGIPRTLEAFFREESEFSIVSMTSLTVTTMLLLQLLMLSYWEDPILRTSYVLPACSVSGILATAILAIRNGSEPMLDKLDRIIQKIGGHIGPWYRSLMSHFPASISDPNESCAQHLHISCDEAEEATRMSVLLDQLLDHYDNDDFCDSWENSGHENYVSLEGALNGGIPELGHADTASARDGVGSDVQDIPLDSGSESDLTSSWDALDSEGSSGDGI